MRLEELFAPVLEESILTDVRMSYKNFVNRYFNKKLYHTTTTRSLGIILQMDSLLGTFTHSKGLYVDEPPSLMRKNKGFVSLSRSRNNAYSRINASMSNIPMIPMFELDGRKIAIDYESMNVDWWREKAKHDGSTAFDDYLAMANNEHEVRVYTGRSGIKPLSNYLISTSVLINNPSNFTKKVIKDLEELGKICTVFYYFSYTDFITESNAERNIDRVKSFIEDNK